MQRRLTIIAAVVVGLGVIAGVYFFFFYNASPGIVATGSSGADFGSGTETSTGTTGTSDTGTTDESVGNAATVVAPRLTEISGAPVGKGFIAVAAASTTGGVDVRYIDRESGNMYDYNTQTTVVTRTANHTVPGVEEVSWLPDGSSAYVRYLAPAESGGEHIDTYRLPIDGSDGAFLAQDLSVVLPLSNTSLFVLLPNTSGSTGYIVKADGSSPVTLFSSLFSSLAVKNSAGAMVAYTKPSADLSGYAFLVDKKSGSFTSILGPLTALSALPSPSGSLILVSYLDQGTVRLGFYDTRSHTTTIVPVQTFADKCVWSNDSLSAYCGVPTAIPSANLPDDWYQGTVHFSDRIWKIDFVARVATLAVDLPTLTSAPIDAVSLTLDPEESTLVFMNRQDDSLWAYSL